MNNLLLLLLLFLFNSCYDDCKTIQLATKLDSGCSKSEIIEKIGYPRIENKNKTEMYYKISNKIFTEDLIFYLDDSGRLINISYPKGMLEHCNK